MKIGYLLTLERKPPIFNIMNHEGREDIAIGLASTQLSKMVYVLLPKGLLFEEKDSQMALALRYLKAKARKQGIYGKGPKRLPLEERAKFMCALTKILSDFAGI